MSVNLKDTNASISRQLITLAAPLLLGSILQQLYNAADSIVIQRFAGDAAFAAAGIAGIVMNLFIFLINGGCTGISIVMASLYGAEDYKTLRCESYMGALYGCGFSILLSLFSILLMTPVLKLINTPDNLLPLARQYLTVIFAGMPAVFLYNFCAAALRAIGDTSHATVFLSISVVSNVLLDLLLIGKFSMGMTGAALATVASQIISAVLCIIYISKKRSFLLFRRADMKTDKELLKRTARFASISALNQSSLYIGKLLVQGSVNSIDPLGTAAIPGFTAGSRIEAFTNAVGLAGGDAVSVFVAQNIGAGNGKRAREGFKKGCFLLFVVGLLMSAIMYIPAVPAVTIFVGNSAPAALAEGVIYLRVVALFYAICFIDCAFLGWNRGSGELDIFMTGTIAQVVIRVVLAWILAPRMGLVGVALATGIGWAILAVYKTIMYIQRQKKEAF